MNPKLGKSDLRDILKASYMPQKQASEYMAKRGYGYDPELSTMTQKVFLSPEGKPIIAERGSTRVSDWLIEDPKALFGLPSDRIKSSKELNKATFDKYGIDATNTGHSLGGYIAEKGANKGANVYTYNKASGIPALFNKTSKNQTDYRTTLDIPSAFSTFQHGGKQESLTGSYNPIESHNLKYLK